MGKKLSLNIAQKASIGFITIIILIICITYLSISNDRIEGMLDSEIKVKYEPLIDNLKSLSDNQKESMKIVQEWISSQSLDDKQQLKTLVNIQYPKLRVSIGRLLLETEESDIQRKIRDQLNACDGVVDYQIEIMELLTSKADFENIERMVYCRELLDKNTLPIYQGIIISLDSLIRDIIVRVDAKKMQFKDKARIFDYLIYIFSIFIVCILVFFLVRIPVIMKRVKKLQNELSLLGAGNITDKLEVKGNDELGVLEERTNSIITELDDIKYFITEVGKGNINIKTEKLEKYGVFGDSLKNMISSLEEIEKVQEDQRKIEEIRNWVTSGTAKFNEILRLKNENIDDLSYDIVKELVKYTESIIGGIYILKKNDQGKEKLFMSSLFAYDRKRYLETEIEPREGLIGTAFVERHKIHLKEIPEDYINISSGLGEAPPNELLIVPILHEDKIHGVIEIATLETYSDYVIEFIEKIADGLATSISSVLINSETARLLNESNERTERMHAQEEELRQNMEELQAAQEERERQVNNAEGIQKNLEEIIKNLPFPVFVKDNKRKYLIVNREQEKLFDLTSEEIIGNDDSKFIKDQNELEEINRTDNQILEGNKRVEIPSQKITFKDGTFRQLKTIKTAIKDHLTGDTHILGFSHNI